MTPPALILAPHGRDATVACGLLADSGIPSIVCDDIADFENQLGEGISFAIVTEEALRFADLRGIGAHLTEQPAWSDLPFIILTQHNAGLDRDSGAKALAEFAGNITFLERPFHPATFVSVARSALRGRQRQFELRAHIKKLHDGEVRLHTALVAGRLGAWELDLVTRTLTTSPTYKAVFGRAADAPFSYDDLIAAIHPDDRRAVLDALRQGGEGGDYAATYRTTWPDGSQHWAESQARLVTGADGNPRLVGVSSDITARVTSDEKLRRLNETLEERVAARTAELEEAHAGMLAEIAHRERAEEQLRQAQKMEMIGQLTGGVAHDFNNLLMAVIGNLDLLRKYLAEDPRAARLINGALQGAQRGASLTQRLLAFARRQDLRVASRDIGDLIRGATDLIERSIGSRIELRLDLPQTAMPALVDTNQVELAVLNLVVNARDAMPQGGTLSIAVNEIDLPDGDELPADRYVRIVIRDTGSGMDAATLQKATEPFFSTKELGKGTGLGLSMVHGLAVQLHGALRLHSQIGVGTTAELWLPRTALAVEEETSPALAPKDIGIGKITILVVDDDALIAMSTVDMLEDLGHDVIEANSGEGALDILKDGRAVDLLITDYSMPRMNGAQLASAARSLRPDLPILLATGYAELPEGSSLDLPRLAKPYQQNQLAAEVAKLVRHERQLAASR